MEVLRKENNMAALGGAHASPGPVATYSIKTLSLHPGLYSRRDSMIFLAAMLFTVTGARQADRLLPADLPGGYAHWALPTLLIKMSWEPPPVGQEKILKREEQIPGFYSMVCRRLVCLHPVSEDP